MAWEQLISIRDELAAYVRDERISPPVACPNDGEPLDVGRRGVRHCPWGDFEWPRGGS